MTTKLLIDRELLERLLYVMDNYVTHETPEEDELRAILAAPVQGELVEALRAADEYLSSNKFNEIGSGSILHRQMQAALAKWEGKA